MTADLGATIEAVWSTRTSGPAGRMSIDVRVRACVVETTEPGGTAKSSHYANTSREAYLDGLRHRRRRTHCGRLKSTPIMVLIEH